MLVPLAAIIPIKSRLAGLKAGGQVMSLALNLDGPLIVDPVRIG